MMRKICFVLFELVFFAGIGTLFLTCKKKTPEKMLIVFDSVSNETVQTLQSVLKEYFNGLEKDFDWKTLDSHQSLSEFIEQHPQTALIFALNNRGLFEARRFFLRHSPESFQNLPSTFQNSIFSHTGENADYAFPLLINPVNLAYNTTLWEKQQLKSQPASIEALEKFCDDAKRFASFPFICAGGDDEQLFAVISALTSMLGLDNNFEDYTELAADGDLQKSCPPVLKTVLKKLTEWRQRGFLHPEWFRLVESDVSIFMEIDSTACICLPFSAARRLKSNIHRRFTTAQIPLPTTLSKKNMAADVIVCAQMANKAENSAVNAIREFLYRQKTNELLAQKTGLAPVFSSAQTIDADASSGRYWVAASNKTLPLFSNFICTTREERNRLAVSIRRYLEVNGLGYEN